MKIGVIGLGSMGKRRVRDLKNLGCEVSGFDISGARRIDAEKLLSIRALNSFDELQDSGIEAAVISTPPDVHVDYYEKCFAARLPFFSEAGIAGASFSFQESIVLVRLVLSLVKRSPPSNPLL